MKAKAAFYFLILCRQLLSLERGKKVSKLRSIAELGAFYGNYLLSWRWRRERIENKKLALHVEIYEYSHCNNVLIIYFPAGGAENGLKTRNWRYALRMRSTSMPAATLQ